MTQPRTPTRRPAFTLVELLVVMALIALISGLTLAVLSSMQQNQQSSTGAERVHSWLMIARQRALLDRAPRGVRMHFDQTNPRYITSAEYLEQPDDFSEGKVYTTPGNNAQLVFNLPVTGSLAANDVNPGDFIQVSNAGPLYRILALPSANTATIQTPLRNAIDQNYPAYYRIIRQPRPLGEEAQKLPAAVGVDMKTNTDFGQAPAVPPDANGDGIPDSSIDIMFSPSGGVMGNPAADKMIFWVRETDDPDPFRGRPILIVLYTRTGFVSMFRVDLDTPTNPYTFVD